MEMISLIYTRKLDCKEVENLLEGRHGFHVFKKDKGIYTKDEIQSSIKLEKNRIEIMFQESYLKEIALLIKDLSSCNQNNKITIKSYKEKVRGCIEHILTGKEYYWV